MASGRSRGRGPVRGSIKGDGKYWLSEAGNERRFNHAMDTASTAIGKTTTCRKCGGELRCYNAAVTEGYGARSWWKCSECGHESTKEISPEQMERYYHEDLHKALSSPREAEA